MIPPAVLARLRKARTRAAVRWVLTVTALAASTVGMLAIRQSLDKAHVALVYLLIVLLASAAGGRALGLVVAACAFLCFDYFFLVPYLTFTIENPLDWLVLIAFLVTSIVAAQLLHRANATAEAATQRAVEVDRLAALGAETLNAADAYDALGAIAEVIRASVEAAECEIHLPDIDQRVIRAGRATRAAPRPGSLVEWILERAASAVELADGTIRLAPRADGTGPAVRALAMPLRVRDRVVGVLRVAAQEELLMTPEQRRMLEALSYYAALGAERAHLVVTAERAETERRLESLRNALLMAVSHDLRTPLTTIKGVANEIRRGADAGRAAIIESEADRMNALVGDLLDLSRIQAGAVRPAVAVNTIDDLVGAALRAAAGALDARQVDIDVSGEPLCAGLFDFTHTLRVMVNLLDNAAKYSPAGTSIDVRVRRRDDRIAIDVMDRGPGVDASERDRIFDPFYRPPGVPPDVRGHGLGLSIARGLAEAEGGSLHFSPRQGGGSMFTLELRAAACQAFATDAG